MLTKHLTRCSSVILYGIWRIGIDETWSDGTWFSISFKFVMFININYSYYSVVYLYYYYYYHIFIIIILVLFFLLAFVDAVVSILTMAIIGERCQLSFRWTKFLMQCGWCNNGANCCDRLMMLFLALFACPGNWFFFSFVSGALRGIYRVI